MSECWAPQKLGIRANTAKNDISPSERRKTRLFSRHLETSDDCRGLSMVKEELLVQSHSLASFHALFEPGLPFPRGGSKWMMRPLKLFLPPIRPSAHEAELTDASGMAHEQHCVVPPLSKARSEHSRVRGSTIRSPVAHVLFCNVSRLFDPLARNRKAT